MDMKQQRFGIEIELTGIARKRGAEIVAAYFGTQSYYAELIMTSMLRWIPRAGNGSS